MTIAWRNATWASAFAASLSRAAGSRRDVPVELVVVVNGLEGTTAADRIAADIPTTTVRLPHNTGFAGGANAGVAASHDYDVLIVSNLDVVFSPSFVDRIAAAWCEEWDVLVPQVLEPGPQGSVPNGAARRGWYHRHHWVRPQPIDSGPVEAGNGSCVVLRREAVARRVAECGALFDPEYHSFNEDIDLFWWANRRGLRVVHRPEVVVSHALAGSFDQRHRFSDRTPDVQRRVMANYRVTVWKHASSWLDWAGWVAGELVYLGQAVVADPARGPARYLQSWADSITTARRIRHRRRQLRPVESRR